MNTSLQSPAAANGPSQLADWIELKALFSDDRNASLQDLVAELRRDGSFDAVLEEDNIYELTDSGGEVTERIANDTFSEIEDRDKATESGYPFLLNGQYIQLKSSIDAGSSTYIFLLLLSYFGADTGKAARVHPERKFEDISLEAAKSYFGRNPHDGWYPFGFPRRGEERNFHLAVDKLSQLLHEGEGSRHTSISRDKKDAGLDLVVWHGFVDQNPSQLIAFGQCTTAKNWRDKVYSLPLPIDWCRLWMLDTPAVSPVRMLFIPHRPDKDQWREASILGGILFDRCRIAYHAPTIPDDIATSCAKWIDVVFKEDIHANR